MDDDTIAAVSTPFGEGAIAVVRLSGPAALEIADAVFCGKRRPIDVPGGRVLAGRLLRDGSVVDEVLLTVFRGPRSHTGEDVVEIGCHGGVVVTRGVLDAVLQAGARLAEPGEFTRRAFLRGKMDLTQAEAVMDLIRARSELSARAAARQLEGRLGALVGGLREEGLTALAHLEAFIDFPEEGIDPESGAVLAARLHRLRAGVDRLLATADEGRMLREGVRLVISGEPNVGKSSLLNALLGRERAIVSPQPGTTRDTVEENLVLGGVPFHLVDTAGLRATGDPVEAEGMRRARREVAEADVILQVHDGAHPPVPVPPAGPRVVLVLNKRDLLRGPVPEGMVPVCCLTGEGLNGLVREVLARVALGGAAVRDEVVAINARHQDALRRCAAACGEALAVLERGEGPEFASIELRCALDALGEITGAVDTEELLGRIFSTFCIGK